MFKLPRRLLNRYIEYSIKVSCRAVLSYNKMMMTMVMMMMMMMMTTTIGVITVWMNFKNIIRILIKTRYVCFGPHWKGCNEKSSWPIIRLHHTSGKDLMVSLFSMLIVKFKAGVDRCYHLTKEIPLDKTFFKKFFTTSTRPLFFKVIPNAKRTSVSIILTFFTNCWQVRTVNGSCTGKVTHQKYVDNWKIVLFCLFLFYTGHKKPTYLIIMRQRKRAIWYFIHIFTIVACSQLGFFLTFHFFP